MTIVDGLLRIGIDASAIPANGTGVGTYVYGLIRGLAEIDSVNQYTVFCRPEQWRDVGVSRTNFRLFAVDHRSRVGRLLWEQTLLPINAKRLRLDVLHSPHYTMPLLKGTRSAVTFHDLTFQLLPDMHERSKRFFFRWFMRFSSRRADLLIAVSRNTKNDMVRLLGIAPARICTTVEAADPVFRVIPRDAVIDVCSRYDLIAGAYVLYVGVLEPRKNVTMLVKSYAAIRDQFPTLPLVLVGKRGWMYEEIFTVAKHAGVVDTVKFLGHIPQQDLVGLYNGARVFVYPSKYEGFGLPVLEAMQCGAPVVTSAVSAIPEITGDAAILIDPDSNDELTESLRRVLSDDKLAAELSSRGRVRAATFTWTRCARETLAAYERCAAPGTR